MKEQLQDAAVTPTQREAAKGRGWRLEEELF